MVCCVQWEDLVKLSVQFNVPLGTLCHPLTNPPGGMLCTISVVKLMYHEVLSFLQAVHINAFPCACQHCIKFVPSQGSCCTVDEEVALGIEAPW